jgi:hypothetical protein
VALKITVLEAIHKIVNYCNTVIPKCILNCSKDLPTFKALFDKETTETLKKKKKKQ